MNLLLKFLEGANSELLLRFTRLMQVEKWFSYAPCIYGFRSIYFQRGRKEHSGALQNPHSLC